MLTPKNTVCCCYYYFMEYTVVIEVKKLNSRTSDQCLESALNVLARGLEANQCESELWYEYLCLYWRHGHAEDFSDWCMTALQHAASLNIWWKVNKVNN